MTNTETGRPREYTTAEFRKDMAEVFETARFRDEIVDVSHHGKPWVSIMSPQSAEFIRKVRAIGSVEASEVSAIVSSLELPIGVEELIFRISDARSRNSS
jgi:hypothetical protein